MKILIASFPFRLYQSENKISLFYQMIAQLSDLSQAAQPTAFHNVLRALDDRGRLLRVYTQNIDAIEQKCGLSFGVPEFDCKRSKPKSKGKAKDAEEGMASDMNVGTYDTMVPLEPAATQSPPVELPRCIPLHGTLQSMHCQVCNHAFPLSDYLPSLASGLPPSCPECTNLEMTRQIVGKRLRGIGRLRPSVVLYNENHKDGEGVGDVVQKDLMGASKGKGKSGADLLLVVGTSLKVPGTKRMAREFSKAVKARGMSSPKVESGSATRAFRPCSGLATPAASPRRSPTADVDPPLPKSLYINLDFPVPTREWEGVFDVWIQGDAQLFAEMLQAEINKEVETKELANERKRKREEEAASSAKDELTDLGRIKEKEKENEWSINAKRAKRRRNEKQHRQVKKRKGVFELPSPPYSSPSPTPVASHETLHEEERESSPLNEPSRLILRIPAARRPCYVPEMRVTTHVSQYVGGLRRQRSLTPPFSPPPNKFNKHTKAGRRAMREAGKARKAAQMPSATGPIPLCPPCRSYVSHLQNHHRESFIRSSAQQHEDELESDVDVQMQNPLDILTRTSQLLGMCEIA